MTNREASDPVRLLVIGASSLVGRRVAECAAKAPYDSLYRITLASRKRLTCQHVVFDLERPRLGDASASFDAALVCCPIWLISEAGIMALKSMGIERIVCVSSMSRWSKQVSNDLKEASVAKALAMGEERLIKLCEAHALSFTILRPTMIYDWGRDQNISQIGRTIDKIGAFFTLGKACGLRQPVHAIDLAKACLEVVITKATHNQTYDLGGGEVLSYRDMVLRLFAAKRQRPLIIDLPETLWHAAIWGVHSIKPSSKQSVNIEMIKRMRHDLIAMNEPAGHDFGYDPSGFEPLRSQ